MNWQQFKTHVPGKWVLAGEHSVLKGVTAVALPHPELGLTLSFDPGPPGPRELESFEVEPSTAKPLMLDLIRSIQEAWQKDGRSFLQPSGQLRIDSTIPIGAGLGSSAALCVALTQWMASPLAIPESHTMELATQLEHRFHGKSSGMDVAVIAVREPIAFVMGEGGRSIGVKKIPKFTFHDTQMRSRTSDCVRQVDRFREDAPALAAHVDENMGKASKMAMQGLIQYDAGHRIEGLRLIQVAMNLARECFYSWELVPGEAKRMEEELLKRGALAVKLTGAGGGGMLVALWDDDFVPHSDTSH